MSNDEYAYIDGDKKHPDPAVQALIDNSWLGEWEGPVTIADLESAVVLVRRSDAWSR